MYNFITLLIPIDQNFHYSQSQKLYQKTKAKKISMKSEKKISYYQIPYFHPLYNL